MRGTTRRTRRLVAGLACAATVALAGCTGGAPGVAAEVGSQRITDSQLNSAVAGVAQALGASSDAVSKQAVLDALIRGKITDQIAAERGIVITDGQREAKLATDESGARLLTVPAAKQVGYDLADEQILAEKLGTNGYTDLLGKAKVTMNPRYGTWDSGVVARSGSLSDPVGGAVPSP